MQKQDSERDREPGASKEYTTVEHFMVLLCCDKFESSKQVRDVKGLKEKLGSASQDELLMMAVLKEPVPRNDAFASLYRQLQAEPK